MLFGRPSFITLYLSVVDSAGHKVGPHGNITDYSLSKADEAVGILLNGLRLRNLENCVNIIVLADHGKTSIAFCE